MAETATLTLADFLLARIAEDEAGARAAFRDEHPSDAWGREPRKDSGRWSTGDHEMDAERIDGIGITIYAEGGHNAAQARHIARWDPARVLAECEAKRRIVERLRGDAPGGPDGQIGWDYRDPTLLDLAASYADHPDFRDEWRA